MAPTSVLRGLSALALSNIARLTTRQRLIIRIDVAASLSVERVTESLRRAIGVLHSGIIGVIESMTGGVQSRRVGTCSLPSSDPTMCNSSRFLAGGAAKVYIDRRDGWISIMKLTDLQVREFNELGYLF